MSGTILRFPKRPVDKFNEQIAILFDDVWAYPDQRGWSPDRLKNPQIRKAWIDAAARVIELASEILDSRSYRDAEDEAIILSHVRLLISIRRQALADWPEIAPVIRPPQWQKPKPKRKRVRHG